ncbi:MAG TPA: UDP-3-O-(3-hydroxymyristoyl)glucosamine N-acyltransferase [Bryobacteraceae bacterium]
MRVKELAAWLDAPFEGDGEVDILGVAALEDATAADLSFVTRGRAAKNAEASLAGCLVVPLDYANPSARTVIRARDPRAAVARAIVRLHPAPEAVPGIHPSAVLGPGCSIAATASLGPFVALGKNVRIGEGTSIGAGCALADGVEIGDRCTLHPRVTLYPGTRLGNQCILHSGAVIGADGFGFILTPTGYEKFPQIGRVDIADRVEIGAGTCIDRAALGVTSIGEGTKLDNMVHIGHNCRIGRHVVIAAQTGLSGGVVVEDYAVIGGQVGIGDKARIESKAVLGSGSGVLTSKIVHGGQVMWGTPARPLREHLEQLAVLSQLAKKRRKKE